MLGRWVIIGVAALLLLANDYPAARMIGWAAWAVGVLYNVVMGHLSKQHRPLRWLRHVSAALDVALITAIIIGLRGPINAYIALYLLSVANAALCFGPRGTIIVGVVDSVLASLLALLWFDEFSAAGQLIPTWGLIMGTSVLAGVLTRRIGEQLHVSRDRADQLEKKLTELAVLQELGQAVHDLQSENTLQDIVEVSAKILGFRRAALFITTDGKTDDIAEGYFSSRDYIPSEENDGEVPSLPRLHFDKDLFAAMLQTDRPFIIDGSQGSPLMARGPMLQIATPLRGEHGPVGVLVVDCDDREGVKSNDLEMLSGLAKSAVLAIENARLHNRVQRMANLDGLTNLYNHRYFQESLRRTLREAQAKRQPVSLIMVEVDKFKVFNDNYGHLRGDQVLRSIARALGMATRQWDGEVARYGGDEFMIILPGIDTTTSVQIAQDMLSWTTEMVTLELQRYNLPGVRFSLGVATYPDDTQDVSGLIDAADQAMYLAKRQGGNQARAFHEVGSALKQPRYRQYHEQNNQSPVVKSQ
ncbi:MAG: GGDEF domain-containing protein [Chloroflexota bacterium]|nr:GGDEF domain-containing protein [Chloroflexota bacterium]